MAQSTTTNTFIYSVTSQVPILKETSSFVASRLLRRARLLPLPWLLYAAMAMTAFGTQSHRTNSSVKSASSSRLLLVFLAVSLAFAVPVIPLTESVFISATGFHVYNSDEVWVERFPAAWRGTWRGVAREPLGGVGAE